MPIRLSVSLLKDRIRSDNTRHLADPVNRARVELNGVLTLLNFKKLSFGNLEFHESRREPIYDAICGLRASRVMHYRSTLNLILQTIKYSNISSVEIKSNYQRVDFPCAAWCRKAADATEKDIEEGGGLNPRFASEICYDENDGPMPRHFFFGIHEARAELPLPSVTEEESAPKNSRFRTFGARTYYFLVPRGEFVYAPGGRLTGELAFPELISIADIWFVQDSTGMRLAKWKEDADLSGLVQPSVTAAALLELDRKRARLRGQLVLRTGEDEAEEEQQESVTT